MGTIARIFTRDLKRIVTNPVALLVTLGVAVIPALYAWFNVAASWDPYGNTGNIKVAVVNEDEGTDSDLVGHLDAGQLVLDALAGNDQLGWTLTDGQGAALTREEALSGVESGAYYAAIVIPEGFSQDLASLATGDFHKPSIGYYINEKRNTVVPEIADIGASTVESRITDQFVSTVSQVVAEKVVGVGSEVEDDARQVGSDVAGEVRSVSDSIERASELVGSLDATMDEAQGAVASAQESLDSLAGLADDASGALDDADELLGTTRSAARSLSADLSDSFGRGGSLLAGVSSRANAALGTLTGKLSAATGVVDGTLATAQGALDTSRSLADALAEEVERLDQIPELHGQLGDLQVTVAELQRAVAEQQEVVDTLSKASSDVRAASDALGSASGAVNDAVVGGVNTLSDLRAGLDQTAVPGLTGALDSFGDVSGDLKGVLGGLGPTVTQAQGVLAQLSDALGQVRQVSADMGGSLDGLTEQLDGIASDMEVLCAAVSGQLQDVLDLDAQGIGDFMASPVQLETQVLYPVYKYGASAAPFYTNLAIWVGGFVLVAIYRQEVDQEGLTRADGTPIAVRPWQGYLGRLALFLLVGQLQAIVVCVGDVAMGMQCESPVAFVLAGMVQSLVYVSVVYALAVAFKHIGKALAVVLVILQIPGSSGLYPIEMMPGFFQAVEPWLPFTYGIRAMREAIAGFYGNHYAVALLELLAFLVPAFAVGIGCRRRLVGVNAFFDRRLGKTGLMVSDGVSAVSEPVSLGVLLRALSRTPDYAQAVAGRARRFEAAYPHMMRVGKALLASVPAGLLLMLFALKEKLPVLVVWIGSVVLICAFLIVTEYVHDQALRCVAQADALPGARHLGGTATLPAAAGAARTAADDDGGDAPIQVEAHVEGDDADGEGDPVGTVSDGDRTPEAAGADGGGEPEDAGGGASGRSPLADWSLDWRDYVSPSGAAGDAGPRPDEGPAPADAGATDEPDVAEAKPDDHGDGRKGHGKAHKKGHKKGHGKGHGKAHGKGGER